MASHLHLTFAIHGSRKFPEKARYIMRTLSKQHRVFVTMVAAAAFGVSPLLPFVVNAVDPPAERQAEQTRPLSVPPGFKAVKLEADSGIRSGLVKLTDRAYATGDFKKLLGELSTQDKERAREFKNADQKQLDVVIDQIRTAWKSKYNQSLSIDDKNLVFDSTFAMAQFEVSDPAVAIANWPVPACDKDAVTAGNRSNAGDEKKEEKNAKLTDGRDVALVRVPPMHDMPEMTVSMIHELPMSWRVYLPNDRTGEQIYNDLLSHLTYVRDHQDQWPGDVNDAYRLLAQHAIAAVYGVPASGKAG
jgi:hypothetical protein